MGFYDDLVIFLNGLDDFFIEVEGRPDHLKKFIIEFNSEMNASITMDADGICDIKANANKRGLEFRLYTNSRPHPPLGNEFHKNSKIRHPEYEYRVSLNDLVKPLLFDGFDLGRN